MEDKKKNILIVGLLVIIALLSVLLVVMINTKNTTTNNDSTKDNNYGNGANNNQQEKTKYEEITLAEIEQIVNVDKYINYKNINEISNQDKLSLAVRMLAKEKNNDLEQFTKEELEDAFNKTYLSKLGLIHEGIIDRKYPDDNKSNYRYSYNDGIYTSNETHGHGYSSVYVFDKKVENFTEKDGKYTYSIKYLFGGYGEILYDDYRFYGKYEDSINKQNSLYEVEWKDAGSDELRVHNWFKDNYESIKDKLDTYNYVFIKENGKIDLVDFYVD